MKSFVVPKPRSGSKSKSKSTASSTMDSNLNSNSGRTPDQQGGFLQQQQHNSNKKTTIDGGFSSSLDKETILQPSSMMSIVSERSDPLDATNSTMRSDSDDYSHDDADTYYTVPDSPLAKQFASPPAKLTKSVTYSTKYARDPTEYPQMAQSNSNSNSSTTLSVADLPPAMPSSGKLQTADDPVAIVLLDSKTTLPPPSRQILKHQRKDDFYRVEASPEVYRYASPPAKFTKSVTYSSKFARDPSEHHQPPDSYRDLAVVDLPQSMTDISESAHPAAGKDQYYDVPISPSVQRYESPVPKGSGSVTFSTKFVKDPNYDEGTALADLPLSTRAALKPHHDQQHQHPPLAPTTTATRLNTTLETVEMNSSPDTKSSSHDDEDEDGAAPSPESYLSATSSSNSSRAAEGGRRGGAKGTGPSTPTTPTDPDAKHINRILGKGSSSSSGNLDGTMNSSQYSQYSMQSRSTEDDEYYDVQESPRANEAIGVSFPSLASSAFPSVSQSNPASYNESAHANDFLGTGNYNNNNSNSNSNSNNNNSNSNNTNGEFPSSISAKTGSSTAFFGNKSSSSSSGANYSSSLLYSSESGATIVDSTGSGNLSDTNRMYFTALKGDGSTRPPERRKHKKTFAERNMFYRKFMGGQQQEQQHQGQQQQGQGQARQPYSGAEVDSDFPIDPEGQVAFDDNYSTTGESLAPTPDDENDLNSGSYQNSATANNNNNNDNKREGSPNNKSLSSPSGEKECEGNDENGSENVEGVDPEQTAPSSPPPPDGPKYSPFPSVTLLVVLVVAVVLALGGLVGGLTYYLWDKKTLDPIFPPTPSPVPGAPPRYDVPTANVVAPGVLPTDEELLAAFATVVGQGVFDKSTSAGMAAEWILTEDPSKTLVPRSYDGWLQRYLLVYTYYATTGNRSTQWLSCNPPASDDDDDDDEPDRKNAVLDPTERDRDSCQFAYPTELPGGKIIYDLVPSSRWLTGADECQWGGVACGKTVTDAEGNNSRLAVTSIVLADQSLQGWIVTELAELPELEVLDLSHNGLRGTLRETFKSLQTLRLQYNEMTGTIPSNFFDDQNIMKELNIGSNSMSGTIPDRVGFASQITGLFLFQNEFTGTIPLLGKMPLITFQAQGNKLSGMIPFDYDFGGAWGSTLTTWWAFDNRLTGSISENLGFLSSLEDFRVQGNQLTGTIPASIQELTRMFRFEVQSNLLEGTVPEGIGNLPVLRDVRLQYNSFTGVVPTGLCFLTSMELLQADCLGRPDNAFELEGTPEIECYCCTTCCNAAAKECVTY